MTNKKMERRKKIKRKVIRMRVMMDQMKTMEMRILNHLKRIVTVLINTVLDHMSIDKKI